SLFAITGYDISDLASGLYEGSIGSPDALATTVRWSVPYLLLGAGVIVCLRAGFFNIGAQGQFYAGSVAAVAVALTLPDLPPMLGICACIAAGVAGGAVWSLIPGYLRLRFGADEV